MSIKFKQALVRPPGRSFARGLSSADLGPPDLDTALGQHRAYCDALVRCGVEVHAIAADDAFPDGTFVEDTAILAERVAIAAQPGAPSRVGEVASVSAALARFRDDLYEIVAPGSVDGGDICQVGEHFFIGLSARTNDEGARQLATILRSQGYRSSTIDIRRSRTLLHLKSGIAYIGERRIVATRELALRGLFEGYQLMVVDAEESYAANCVRVNERVLIAAGHPKLDRALREHGYSPLPLEMSEFRKMDGGLSCLSLRF